MEHSIGELPAPGEKVWYIIKKDSHEGPYSYLELDEKFTSADLSSNVQVWARGWPEPLQFAQVVAAYRHTTPHAVEEVIQAQDFAVEPPQTEIEEEQLAARPMPPMRWPLYLGAALMLGAGLFAWKNLTPRTELVRPSEISIARFRELRDAFTSMQRPVPIPEIAISKDYNKIWLLDRTTQTCSYEASFSSTAEQNLGGTPVSFQAQGISAQHWIVLERLNFTEGQKLIPGRYTLNLERANCKVEGIAGWWQKPDQPLSVSIVVDLYAGSPEELQARLEVAAKRKLEEEKKRFEQSRQAWRDIEEKLRTLSAISMQIEQNFKGLLVRRLAWPARLKRVIDAYTLKFGGFLTNFTVKNDEDFAQLALQELPDKVDIMGRQPLINTHAKRIGFVSMRLIEQLQKDKAAPNRRDLQDWLMTMEQDFGVERSKLQLGAEEAQAASTRVLSVPAPQSN